MPHTLLLDITSLPTAAGCEDAVIAAVERWVAARSDLRLTRDDAGNLYILHHNAPASAARPLLITAHLDHPAFVVTTIPDASTIELEFRGGVNDPYFNGARIDIYARASLTAAQPAPVASATITHLDANAAPFKKVTAQLDAPHSSITPGDIARWSFPDDLPDSGRRAIIRDDILHAPACDDLAAVAAALDAFDIIRKLPDCHHVGLMFTRAEEIGFVGAIAACRLSSIPGGTSTRLLCLENSRSFPESPLGKGPIMRVGDRMSVFNPNLTNRLSLLLAEHQRTTPAFTFQRKLMPGGTCEATAFSTFGYESTCVCLALGNYHNMRDIDEVAAGLRPARLGPEYISISDYNGLVDLLIMAAKTLDNADIPNLQTRMNDLLNKHQHILGLPQDR